MRNNTIHYFLLILLAGIVLAGCGQGGFLIKPVPLRNELKETQIERDKGMFIKDKIAVIDVDGLLVNRQKSGLLGSDENPVSLFVEKLDRARDDRNVKAVVLRFLPPCYPPNKNDERF